MAGGAVFGDQPGDRAVRVALDGCDEALHRFGGAGGVRVEARVVRLARFRIVGVREQGDAAIDDAQPGSRTVEQDGGRPSGFDTEPEGAGR